MLKKKMVVAKSFRLFYFDITNDVLDLTEAEGETKKRKRVDEKQFVVQMYGINERGETCSILIDDFEPFFFIKVGDDWTPSKMHIFMNEIKTTIGDYYKDSIVNVFIASGFFVSKLLIGVCKTSAINPSIYTFVGFDCFV